MGIVPRLILVRQNFPIRMVHDSIKMPIFHPQKQTNPSPLRRAFVERVLLVGIRVVPKL